MRTRFADSGAGSFGAGWRASQADTAAMSVSSSFVATRFMQSGSIAWRSPTRQRVSCAAT